MTQATDAAERSAHVQRGPARGCTVSPVVEVSPGAWKLRVLVEAEADVIGLRASLEATFEQVRAWQHRAQKAEAEIARLRAENVTLRADLAMAREREGATGLEYRGG